VQDLALSRRYRATPEGQLVDKRASLRRYSLTPDEYDLLLNMQGGRCAGCGKRESLRRGKRTRLSVDHDHKCCPGERSCGKCIRGLLCATCNTTLARVHDSLEVLRRLAAYLEAFEVEV
jgi:hypothetical protein